MCQAEGAPTVVQVQEDFAYGISLELTTSRAADKVDEGALALFQPLHVFESA